MEGQKTILVTGGAGYVGAVLVPKLLLAGYAVKVLDYLYGDDVLAPVRGNPDLVEIKGDIRDRGLLEKVIPGVDAVIHLACISNDPSFELDPALGKSINYDAFFHWWRWPETEGSNGLFTRPVPVSTASRKKKT